MITTEDEEKLHEEMLENIVRELESQNPNRRFEAEYLNVPSSGGSPVLGFSFQIYEITETPFLRFFKIPHRKEIAYLCDKYFGNIYSLVVYERFALEAIEKHVREYCKACNKKPLFIKM